MLAHTQENCQLKMLNQQRNVLINKWVCGALMSPLIFQLIGTTCWLSTVKKDFSDVTLSASD